jgi:hypothetical protein
MLWLATPLLFVLVRFGKDIPCQAHSYTHTHYCFVAAIWQHHKKVQVFLKKQLS